METAGDTNFGPLKALLRSRKVRTWDAVLIGDGSGSGWASPCGWSVVLHDRASGGRRRFFGGMSAGTSGIAELLPYVHALAWYTEYLRRLPAAQAAEVRHVHIVSDNAPLVAEGEALSAGSKGVDAIRSNRPFWAALLAYERQGFVLHYHWIARVSVALNGWSDAIAGACFGAMKRVPLPVDDRGKPVGLYDLNYGDDAAGSAARFTAHPPRRRAGRGRACPDREGA